MWLFHGVVLVEGINNNHKNINNNDRPQEYKTFAAGTSSDTTTATKRRHDHYDTTTKRQPRKLQEKDSLYDYMVTSEFTVAEWIDQVGLTYQFDNTTATWTFFAPTNAAIDALPLKLRDYITLENDEKRSNLLRTILWGHLVEVALSETDLRSMDSITFYNRGSRDITVNDDNDTIVMIGEATIENANLYEANNGILHTIDRLINIPSLESYLEATNPVLLLALQVTNIWQDDILTLQANGATLFAPTTFGFATLSTIFPTLERVILSDPQWRRHLRALLRAHITNEMWFTEDVMGGQQPREFTMINSQVVTLVNDFVLEPGVNTNEEEH